MRWYEYKKGKYFVSGQLSHCYKLSLDARKRASRWNVCGSHGDVHSIYGSASPIIAEQNPVPSIFCVPDAPDRKARPRSPTEVGYPAGLPVSIPRNREKEKGEHFSHGNQLSEKGFPRSGEAVTAGD